MVESLFIIIARRRETEQPLESTAQRAPSSFLAYRVETERPMSSEKRGVFLSSAIVRRAFGTISDAKMFYIMLNEKPNNRESADIPFFFFISCTEEPRPMSSDTWLPRSFTTPNDSQTSNFSSSLPETENAERKPRAPSFLYLSLIRDTKTENRDQNSCVLCDRSDTPTERSQFFIIIARRRETEQPRERKRAHLLPFFYISSCTERTKTDELETTCYFKVFRDRSDDAFGTISDC